MTKQRKGEKGKREQGKRVTKEIKKHTLKMRKLENWNIFGNVNGKKKSKDVSQFQPISHVFFLEPKMNVPGTDLAQFWGGQNHASRKPATCCA